MKTKLVIVFVCTLLIASAVPAVGSINIHNMTREQPKQHTSGVRAWSDNFDSYATGSALHGQGGWECWDDNAATTAYVTDDQARSNPNSCEIAWFGGVSADIVQQFTDINSGDWIISSYLYVPSTMSGNSYFILMNDYQHGGPHNNQDWSLQIQFSGATGTIWDFNNVGSVLPLVLDDWAELRVEIDFEADIQTVYYDDTFLLSKSWKDGVSPGGAKNLAAIDLYADSAASTSVYWDDMSLALPEALSCSANGPYDGIVGEEIQFDGTVSGGSTPYEFLWNFGDSETSTEEDPVHIYTDAGEFTVSFTVTDADQTVVSDVTTASIIGEPILEIKKVEGGLLKVTANVKNAGSAEATNVQWSIVLSGGLIILGKETTGQITIAEDITETITSGLIFGFGATTVIVTVEVPESSDMTENDGFVLLFFVKVNPGGG